MRFFHHPTPGLLVPEATRGRVFIERGDIHADFHDHIALVAQYSVGPNQPRSLSEYLKQLDAHGFSTVVISTCEAPGALTFPFGIPDSTIIIRRPNAGYDFGSWATALGMIPHVRQASTVLLTNDSLVGPFAPISDLLEWVSTPGPNLRGLTASYQFARHLQSYFLAFLGGILDEEPWRDFFNGIRVEPGKESVVLKYEIGVSKVAFREGYSTQGLFAGPELGVPTGNPTVEGWKQLIERGVPFVKRTMLTNPATVKERAEVQSFVNKRFDVDIDVW